MQPTEKTDAFQQVLAAALVQHQAGKLGAAEVLYRQILTGNPDHAKALGLLGLIEHDKGNTDAGIGLLRRSIAADPANPNTRLNLGTVFAETGRTDAAIEQFREALKLDPNHLNALNNVAKALRDQKRIEESLPYVERIAALQPGSPQARYALGVTLRELRRFDRAAVELDHPALQAAGLPALSYERGLTHFGLGNFDQAITHLAAALRQTPRLFEAHFILGSIYAERGKFADALPALEQARALNPVSIETLCLLGMTLVHLQRPAEGEAFVRQAVKLAPRNMHALNTLGNLLHSRHQLAEAERVYAEALVLEPDNADVNNSLGELHLSREDYPSAIPPLDRAVAARPDFATALANLSLANWMRGDEPRSRQHLTRATELSADPHLKVTLGLMIPQIMGTSGEILESRARYERNLDALLDAPPALMLPHPFVGTSNFYLAYHGIGNKALLSKYAALCLASCPALKFTAPHCENGRRGDRPVRIGFVSNFIMNHSVSICFSKIVEALAATLEFDVHLISQHPFDDASVRVAYPDFTGKKIQLHGGDFAAARATIADLKLDVLVYMDIGMDLTSYFLALARLAPVQCSIGGHPDTTGIPNIDYYLSSAVMEAEDADTHYSEKLLRLPIGVFYYRRPQLPYTSFGYKKGRAEFGLPAQGRLYLCPTVLQKMHPDFDAAIARILELDPTGHVVLFKDPKFDAWTERLSRRLDRTIPAALRKRAVFISWIPGALDFTNAVALADVILDPFHFGMGSTAITTYAAGVPTVTMPTPLMRGRTGLFYCKFLDLPECVAADAEDYAQKAVSIAANRDFREQLSRRILKNNSALYDNMQPIHDLVAALEKL